MGIALKSLKLGMTMLAAAIAIEVQASESAPVVHTGSICQTQFGHCAIAPQQLGTGCYCGIDAGYVSKPRNKDQENLAGQAEVTASEASK